MKQNLITGAACVDGGNATFTLNVPIIGPSAAQAQRTLAGMASHSPDFSQVNWFGTVYYFRTREERAVVGHLWRSAEKGNESIDQAALLDVADCEYPRLRDVFGKHPAWGTMIVQDMNGEAGSYKLSQQI